MPRPRTSESLGVKPKCRYLIKFPRRLSLQPGLRRTRLRCITGLCLKNHFFALSPTTFLTDQVTPTRFRNIRYPIFYQHLTTCVCICVTFPLMSASPALLACHEVRTGKPDGLMCYPQLPAQAWHRVGAHKMSFE